MIAIVAGSAFILVAAAALAVRASREPDPVSWLAGWQMAVIDWLAERAQVVRRWLRSPLPKPRGRHHAGMS